MVLPARF